MKQLPPAASPKIFFDILRDEIRLNQKTNRRVSKLERKLAIVTDRLSTVQDALLNKRAR